MRWRVRRPEAHYRALRRWHKWFAWRPVRVPNNVGTTKIWLETIMRRGCFVQQKRPTYVDSYWKWEYKYEI